MIWKVIFRGIGRGDPGPFFWIHTVFLVRQKRITQGYVNWSLLWFINSVYPFPNLSTRETIYVDCKQALRLVDILKNRATCGFATRSRGSLSSPLEMRARAPRRPFVKAENTTVFWAVPHVNMTFAFCCVRCVNWRCSVSDAILKEADALHVQIVQRAKDIARWGLKKIVVFSALANFEVRSIGSVSRIRMKAVHVQLYIRLHP